MGKLIGWVPESYWNRVNGWKKELLLIVGDLARLITVDIQLFSFFRCREIL